MYFYVKFRLDWKDSLVIKVYEGLSLYFYNLEGILGIVVWVVWGKGGSRVVFWSLRLMILGLVRGFVSLIGKDGVWFKKDFLFLRFVFMCICINV